MSSMNAVVRLILKQIFDFLRCSEVATMYNTRSYNYYRNGEVPLGSMHHLYYMKLFSYVICIVFVFADYIVNLDSIHLTFRKFVLAIVEVIISCLQKAV